MELAMQPDDTLRGPPTGADTRNGVGAQPAPLPAMAAAMAQGAGPRPSVISLAIREKAALYAAYMRFVEGGGLFIPTTRAARLGDEIYAILTLMDDPGKVPLPGKVCWITPAGVPGRPQGIGIQFAKNEVGEAARLRIEALLSGALQSARAAHTI